MRCSKCSSFAIWLSRNLVHFTSSTPALQAAQSSRTASSITFESWGPTDRLLIVQSHLTAPTRKQLKFLMNPPNTSASHLAQQPELSTSCKNLPIIHVKHRGSSKMMACVPCKDHMGAWLLLCHVGLLVHLYAAPLVSIQRQYQIPRQKLCSVTKCNNNICPLRVFMV